MQQKIIQKIQKAPAKPGVYIFYQKKTPLYIGKAINLKNRLKNYLRPEDLKTQTLQKEIDRLEYKILRSEIEALIVESQLIKKLKPVYNVMFRDDKNYFYVVFTKEKFPRIFATHKEIHNYDAIGPFTDGIALKTALRLIRKIFPYCTCKTEHNRPCLNAQIGNCLGFCCLRDADIRMHANDAKKYNKNIKAVKEILLGNAEKLPRRQFSEEQLKAIDNVLAHREFLDTTPKINRSGENKHIFYRVECYDISHLAGRGTVGVMTVFIDGQPAVKEWRKFKIRTAPKNDDPRAIAEILKRRLNHPEWPYSDLIIIDGGIAQFAAAQKVLKTKNYKLETRLISFAKPKEQIYGLRPDKKPTLLAQAPKEIQAIVKKAIRVTHRWAIKYHRQTRTKLFLEKMV